MKKQNVRTLSLIVGTFTYLLIGAAIFDAIESEEERRHKEALEKLEDQMLIKYKISEHDFNILEEVVQLQQPYKAGKPWKFAGSFYYATTVLTTIGYGHSTPKTDGGKMFTMIYAIIGIPIGLVMFNSIGERFNYFASMIINKFRKMVKARQPETTELDLICVGLTLSGIVFTSGAAAFSHYEGWTYYHSMYYCFTTLTTIGFGDFVALQQDNALETKPEYVTFALFFIVFGLAIIAALLNLMVLKFMTMNTEDEKKDEAQALQNAAHTVHLDGDIIHNQNEIRPYYAEGQSSGSVEDVRSVCSCTAFDPFRIKARRRLKKAARAARNQRRGTMETEDTLGGTRCSTTMKWYSTDSLHTKPQSPVAVQSCEMTRVVKNVQKSPAGGGGAKIKSELKCQNIVVNRPIPPSEKAGSVHDLRRCAVSSLLRVPPQYTTFNERPRPPKPLPKSVAVQVQSIKDLNDQVIVLQTEDIELESQDGEEEGATADSSTQTRCTSPTETDVRDSSKFVLINGFDLSRLLKLAKKWTLRRGQPQNSEADSYDGNQLPLEEMQKNSQHSKRASL